ncbi:hypothetical protein QQ045_015971 [Rhodiola kirilowii]
MPLSIDVLYLSIDCTHMYGKYDVKVLVACSLDANNGVLLTAFHLVESENILSKVVLEMH